MYKNLLQIAIVLAFVVIMLGAYTRLSNAGLGCPDWPGCYGQLIVPSGVDGANIEGYERPLDAVKGWKEMLHRYVAALLGLVIFVIFWMTLKGKPKRHQSLPLPTFTALFAILQGVFGMWTITLLVHPSVVTIHLMGGFVTTSLLAWLWFNQTYSLNIYQSASKSKVLLLVIVCTALVLQIMLGGWTSTNYAALACGPEFPTCSGAWWPATNFTNAFEWKPLGQNYEYGVLDNTARSTIQLVHRLGAVVAALLFVLMIYVFRGFLRCRANFVFISVLLIMQITLGIFNVLLSLPIFIAILHNIIALLLLLSTLSLAHKILKKFV